MANAPVPLLKTAREVGLQTHGTGMCSITASAVLALDNVKVNEGARLAAEHLRNEVAKTTAVPLLGSQPPQSPSLERLASPASNANTAE